MATINHPESDLWTCDICGRLRNITIDTGSQVNQLGGYACKACSEWAAKKGITCPTCAGTLAYGQYHGKCTCSPIPTVTRSGRHYEIKGGGPAC